MRSKINVYLPIALALILPGLSILATSGIENQKQSASLMPWFIASSLLYLIWQLLWPLWDMKPKIRTLGIVGMVLLFIGLNAFTWFLGPIETVPRFPWYFLPRLSMGSLLFLTIQYALKTQGNLSSLILEKEQLQTEHYKVQLQALRAQIDPHFLFNSLNTLRSMVRQQHAHSEKFIISLSDFYRQTLKHNERTTLPLSEELEVLESFLFLMKSRNQAAVAIEMTISDAFHGYHLPALALQVVVENCFKHNSMSAKKPLHIQLSSTEDGYISIRNNLQPKLGESDASGYGLELLRKRYELMKVKQGVIVEQTPTHFTVSLKLIEP